jgi:hypothetical protein
MCIQNYKYALCLWKQLLFIIGDNSGVHKYCLTIKCSSSQYQIFDPENSLGRPCFETNLNKISEDSITTNKMLCIVVHTCHLSSEVSRNGMILVQASSGINMRICLKIYKPKSSGGMTQVVKYLPGKCKVLSSNPTMANTPNKKWIPLQSQICIQKIDWEDSSFPDSSGKTMSQ